jgi:ATP-binding cassette subfamily B protein
MPAFPFYPQHDSMDCGPTCIRMAAKYYGRQINIEALRQNAQISKEGVSLLGIAEAAEKVGFNTKGVMLSYNELVKEIKLPAILHWGQNHFVVATPGAKSNKIKIADPAKGLITYTKEEFCKF